VASCFEHFGIEHDWPRGLGEREILVADPLGDHVRVVVRLLQQERFDTPEKACRPGRESRHATALHCPLVGVAPEEPVGVLDTSVVYGEPVEHREAIEPVVDRLVGRFELGRPIADE
jgi:hypothetical protein